MRSLLVLAGLLISLAASAQEIYRWVDKDGVVHFSDQPGADNAVLIKVVEPSSYEPEESGADDSSAAAAASTSAREPAETFPAYRSLTIISPTPDQVFFGADAPVTASAELDGVLNPDHSVAFFLNGERRNADGLGMDFGVLARGTYFLRASILDQAGKPVISSPQVTFHVRQPSVNSPQSPQAPPPPRPQPRPLPAPAR